MVKIIVDSTFGVSREYAKENKIGIVNLKMILDDKVYNEGFEDEWGEFYDKMLNSKTFPTTSQPSPQDFMDQIELAKKDDKNAEVLVLTISSALSGTINSATIAANSYEDGSVVAYDAEQATFGSLLVLEEVVELAKQGKTLKEIVECLPKISGAVSVYFIPENMDSLKRSGRINTLSAKLVDILRIKPIFNFRYNTITIAKKVIGLKRAMVDLVSLIGDNVKKMFIGYIHDDSKLAELKNFIEKKYNNIKTKIFAVNPVFGVHIGVGAVGVAYIENY